MSISAAAHAEITCIGKVGKLDTRVNIFRDVVEKVEILQAGDFPYSGTYTANKQGVLMGSAVSKEGHSINFDIEYRIKSESVTVDVGLENQNGNVSSGTLQCAVLE